MLYEVMKKAGKATILGTVIVAALGAASIVPAAASEGSFTDRVRGIYMQQEEAAAASSGYVSQYEADVAHSQQ